MKAIVARLTIVCVSLIFISLVLTGMSYARIDPKTAVLIWLFDEGKGDVAHDISGNGNDGKLLGNPKWVEGKFGRALEFDGSAGFVEVPVNWTLPNGATWSVWVKFLGGTTGKWEKIISCWKDAEFANRDQLELIRSAGGELWAFFSSDKKAAPGWIAESGVIAKDNEWYFVAGTYDKSSLKVYVNGELKKSIDAEGTMREDGVTFAVAKSPLNEFTNATIDEVLIFNAPLPLDDIKSIMTGLEEAVVTAVSSAGKLTKTWAAIKAQY